MGPLIGSINGYLVTRQKMPSLMTTLGMMFTLRGLVYVYTKKTPIVDEQGFDAFVQLYQGSIGPIPVPGLLALVLIVVAILVTTQTEFGRRIYAIGGNEQAARFSGIRVGRVKLGVYLVSGCTAGIAALLSIGYYGAASSGDGQGYELNVIAAAVVGGASLTGGKGSALGAALGALVIQMISSGIVILGIDQNYSQIIIGSVVIAAVVFDRLGTWLASRRQAGVVR